METEAEPLVPEAIPPSPQPSAPAKAGKIPWLPLAAASGACAAFNGVFAKLTTTELTSSWASAISTFLHFSSTNKFIEFLIRALFFSLNLAFNGLMWALFTSALTRASSTTRVSIVNTSANFILTAFSGWMVFGEKLPGLWWVGAVGLVVGNVVIGRREEDADKSAVKIDGDGGKREHGRRERYRDIGDGVSTDGVDGVELLDEGTKTRDSGQR